MTSGTSIASLPATRAEKVLAKACLRAGHELGLAGAQLARVIGLSESSVSRLASGGRTIDPGSKQGELALLLVRVYRSLDALVGSDKAQRLAWMASFNRALNGTPRDLVQSASGLVAVLAYLDAMRAPV
jgi:transcriptional regulator with XRE-family HTH domain